MTVEHAEIGAECHSANPIRMSRTPPATASAAPLLGEHSKEVLTGVLGLSPEAVEELVAAGVCR